VDALSELLIVDLSCGLVLDLGEDQVNIGGSECLIQNLAVLGHLSEGFTVHLSGSSSETLEDLLERASGGVAGDGGGFALGLLLLLLLLEGHLAEAGSGGDGVNVGGSTLGVDTGVQVFVIVELDIVGFGAGEAGPAMSENLGVDILRGGALLGSDLLKSLEELVEGDPALGLGLDLGKDKINISGGELFVEETAIFGDLSEGLAFHGLLLAVVAGKDGF
jgi:hypothetical protein